MAKQAEEVLQSALKSYGDVFVVVGEASTQACPPAGEELKESLLNLKQRLNAETSAANADYKKTWDSIVAFRNDEYLWWQVAEYTYDSFMIRSRPRS